MCKVGAAKEWAVKAKSCKLSRLLAGGWIVSAYGQAEAAKGRRKTFKNMVYYFMCDKASKRSSEVYQHYHLKIVLPNPERPLFSRHTARAAVGK